MRYRLPPKKEIEAAAEKLGAHCTESGQEWEIKSPSKRFMGNYFSYYDKKAILDATRNSDVSR